MAQIHLRKDSRSQAVPKVLKSLHSATTGSEGVMRQRALGVGLAWINLWVLWVGWPALFSDHLPWGDVALSCLSCGLLALGTRLLRTRHTLELDQTEQPMARASSRIRLGLLAQLVLAPAFLAATVATRPEAQNRHVFDTPTLVFASLSLSLYGASALSYAQPLWLSQQGVGIPLTHHPWMSQPRFYERVRGTILLSVMLIGAVAIGIVAPGIDDFETLEGAWGESVLEGGLLTAVLGGALGVAIVGLSFTEAMRPRSTHSAYSGRGFPRAAAFIAMATLGTIVYWLVRT